MSNSDNSMFSKVGARKESPPSPSQMNITAEIEEDEAPGLYWLKASTECTVERRTHFQHIPYSGSIDTQRLLNLLEAVYGELLDVLENVGGKTDHGIDPQYHSGQLYNLMGRDDDELVRGRFPGYVYGFKINEDKSECTIMVVQVAKEAKIYKALTQEQIDSTLEDSWLKFGKEDNLESLYSNG